VFDPDQPSVVSKTFVGFHSMFEAQHLLADLSLLGGRKQSDNIITPFVMQHKCKTKLAALLKAYIALQ